MVDLATGKVTDRVTDRAAIEAALAFTEERLNGEDGMGAIYPPMANIVMMYEALGKDENFPPRAITRRGIDKLLVIGEPPRFAEREQAKEQALADLAQGGRGVQGCERLALASVVAAGVCFHPFVHTLPSLPN